MSTEASRDNLDVEMLLAENRMRDKAAALKPAIQTYWRSEHDSEKLKVHFRTQLGDMTGFQRRLMSIFVKAVQEVKVSPEDFLPRLQNNLRAIYEPILAETAEALELDVQQEIFSDAILHAPEFARIREGLDELTKRLSEQFEPFAKSCIKGFEKGLQNLKPEASLALYIDETIAKIAITAADLHTEFEEDFKSFFTMEILTERLSLDYLDSWGFDAESLMKLSIELIVRPKIQHLNVDQIVTDVVQVLRESDRQISQKDFYGIDPYKVLQRLDLSRRFSQN